MSKYKHQLSPEKLRLEKKVQLCGRQLEYVSKYKHQIVRLEKITTGRNKRYKSKTQQAQPWQVAACAWRWGAAVPWFGGATALPMEREGAKPLEGRVVRLTLLVVVSVCVVFCVLCSNQRPDICTFFPILILYSFVRIGFCILTRQTVIWDLFQPSARRLYLFSGRNFFWL